MQLQLHTRGLYIPDYDGETNKCTEFITSFQDPAITRQN